MADVIVAEGSALNWTTIKAGAAPAANDNVIFKRNGTHIFTTGPAASVNLASIQIPRGATVVLPGTTTMEVNNSGKGLVIDGAKAVRLILSGNTNIVSVTGSSGAGSDDAGIYLSGGAHAKVFADDGARIGVGASASLTDVHAIDDGVVECEAHASDTIAVARVGGGGRIITSRTILAAIAARGEVRLRDAATIASGGSGSIDMIDERARLVLENTSAITLDLVRCLAGTVDPTGARAGVTFTDTVRTRKSKIIEKWFYGSIAFTNTPTDIGPPGGAWFAVPVE